LLHVRLSRVNKILFTYLLMSRIESVLLTCLIQACTDSYERNGILCDILKKRDRSQLPDIHKALVDSCQRHVAKLFGFKGLFGV